MIINAAYEGPPYANGPYGVLPPGTPTDIAGCGSCRRGANLGNTSPIAGLSYTTVGALVLTALTISAVGLTLWSFRPSTLKGQGERRRRRR
jgi:hypothetical protein